ncbi:hypothetical protein BIW11_00457, partial [Tropilaelaps mercedesae]
MQAWRVMRTSMDVALAVDDTPKGPSRLCGSRPSDEGRYSRQNGGWRGRDVNAESLTKSIALRSCFNINRKHDAKGRLLLALYTSGDCLALQCSTAEEQEEWLAAMLRLQQGTSHMAPDQKPSPHFDHIWEVCVKPKSLGTQPSLQGDQRVCLTARTLSLIRLERHRTTSNNCDHGGAISDYHGEREGPPEIEFTLNSIRRCGHTDCFFFMELGRSSVTGAGELWMQTDDTVIAQNMHEVIL